MKIKKCPSEKILKTLFYYKEGHLYWKKNYNKMKRNDLAGYVRLNGYTEISVNGESHLSHRIIWTLLKGEIPDNFQVDHIDEVKSNGKIENLRLSSHTQNKQNQGKHKSNTSGYKGVNWSKQLGFFDNIELANNAYTKAAIEYHGEFANFG